MTPESTPDIFLVTAQGAPGLSAKEVRGRRFVATSRGVRVRADRLAENATPALAALAGCRPDAVLCDLAAARAWGLPLPPWLRAASDRTPVAVAQGTAEPRRPDVRGRRLRLPPFHVTIHGGARITTPARTWLDCAPLVPFDYLVAMGDAILHAGIASEGELRHLLQWGYRRRGIVNVRAAIPLLDRRSESPGESRTRVLLVGAGLPSPACNYNVHALGRWIARVDMAWIEQRVIVEYDGAVHLEEAQRRRDAERLNGLQAAGWLVIVLTADDLRRPEATIHLVRSALTSRR